MDPLILLLAIPLGVVAGIVVLTSWFLRRRRASPDTSPPAASQPIPAPDLVLASLGVPVLVFGLLWAVVDLGIGAPFYYIFEGIEPLGAFVMGLLYAGGACAAGAGGVVAFRDGILWRWRALGLLGTVLCFAAAVFALLLLWYLPWWYPRYDNHE